MKSTTVMLAGAAGVMPVGHRAVGVVHPPGERIERSYVPSVVPLRYDGLLFIRETRALDELPRR